MPTPVESNPQAKVKPVGKPAANATTNRPPCVTTVHNLVAQGYNVHYFRPAASQQTTPNLPARHSPLGSNKRFSVANKLPLPAKIPLCDARVIVYIHTSAPHQEGEVGEAGLGVFWGMNGTRAGKRNVAQRSPCADQMEHPTVWIAMIRALEKAPDGVDIEVRFTKHFHAEAMTNWVQRWLANGWVQSDGRPVMYQDLIKYLVALQDNRTGNVLYIDMDHPETGSRAPPFKVTRDGLVPVSQEEEDVEGFNAARDLAYSGLHKDLKIRNWNLPPHIMAHPRFQSSQHPTYQHEYQQQRWELYEPEGPVPDADSWTPNPRLSDAPPSHTSVARNTDGDNSTLPNADSSAASVSAPKTDSATEDLADTLNSINL